MTQPALSGVSTKLCAHLLPAGHRHKRSVNPAAFSMNQRARLHRKGCIGRKQNYENTQKNLHIVSEQWHNCGNVCKKKKFLKSKQCTLRYADGGNVLLTRAVGRKACSPGRIRLVLIQFICRCVQHHQEKKSGPQRHRPLNTANTTKCKETPPALGVIHKE